MSVGLCLLAGVASPSRAVASADPASGFSVFALNPFLEPDTEVGPPPSRRLQLQQSQYLSYGKPDYSPSGSSQDTSAIVTIEDQSRWHDLRGHVKMSDQWSQTENWNYLDIHDLSATYRNGNTHVSVGRKLDTWSSWDKEWNQGEFQPRYMENRLRPEQAGLTGVFLYTHDDQWGLTVAALPVFIPDFGTHFETQNNKFVSINPWFHSPAPGFIYQGQPGDIHYSLQSPSPWGVAGHGGGASKLEYRQGGYASRLSLAYKPINDFALGFPSQNRVVVTPTSTYLQVTIIPRIYYSRIVNWDQEYTTGRWQFSGSLAYDHPVPNDAPADWTGQKFSPATIAAGSITRRLFEEGPKSPRVELGFLKINGGDAPDTGPFAAATTKFERRFQFYEAYMLAIKSDFPVGMAYPVETELRMIYDRLEAGGVFSLNSGLNVTRELRVEAQLDLLGLLTSTGSISDAFLSTYRANDRFGMGVSYVF